MTAAAPVSPIRVLLVDDSALLRDGLAGLLDAQPDFVVVGQARNGAEGVEQTHLLMPDLVLMDVEMPLLDGVAAARRIKAELPYITVVMLTVHDADESVFAAIRAGAQGYLLKDIGGSELIAALRGIAAGEAPISRRLAARILREFAQQRTVLPSTPATELTARELEILEMVAARKRNREIADALYISEFTVKNHLRNILAKLHLRNRREAADYARTHGLLGGEPE